MNSFGKHFKLKTVNATDENTNGSYTGEEKTVIITILIALLVMSALVVVLVLTPPENEPFSAIYVLDSQKQADKYPETVVLGENSTFTLWVGVENYNETSRLYQVQLKIDDGTSEVDPMMVDATETFEKTVELEELWEFSVPITIEQLGHNRIIFELWFFDDSNTLTYTGNWVTLTVEATEA
ncbi:MAG: DUF1616 domain-containing protein [Candidatus Bathyarchaeota archaeon]|nr:DUF1616 domain-containing protein [Candidatus Bathyarchaeota archaeon]